METVTSDDPDGRALLRLARITGPSIELRAWENYEVRREGSAADSERAEAGAARVSGEPGRAVSNHGGSPDSTERGDADDANASLRPIPGKCESITIVAGIVSQAPGEPWS